MQSFDKTSLKLLRKKQRCENESLITLLQKVQNEFGYLPKEVLKQVSDELEIPLSKLYSIATFYNSFDLKPQGRNTLSVCLGTACHVKNSGNLALSVSRKLGLEKDEGTSTDGEFTLKKVRCLGCCSMAPVIKVNDEIHGSMTQTKTAKLLKEYGKGRKR